MNLKTPSMRFENRAIQKRWNRDNNVISLSEVPSNTNPNDCGDCWVFKFLWRSVDGKYLMRVDEVWENVEGVWVFGIENLIFYRVSIRCPINAVHKQIKFFEKVFYIQDTKLQFKAQQPLTLKKSRQLQHIKTELFNYRIDIFLNFLLLEILKRVLSFLLSLYSLTHCAM